MTPTSIVTQNNLPVIRRTEIPWELYFPIIATLEAAKNEQFAPETIRVWYEAFQQKGWRIEQIREASLRVMDTNTYGGVRFDHFVSAAKLYTEEEVVLLLSKAVNAKLESFGRLDKEALKVEAIEEMRIKVYRDIDEFRDKHRVDLQARVEAAQKWFLSASTGDQLEVADMVKRVRPTFESDPLYREHWLTMTRMCIADVIYEVEAYQKAVSG